MCMYRSRRLLCQPLDGSQAPGVVDVLPFVVSIINWNTVILVPLHTHTDMDLHDISRFEFGSKTRATTGTSRRFLSTGK